MSDGNGLVPASSRELFEDLRGSLTTDRALLTEPLGHTEFQLRNFTLKQDAPTKDAQYRQGIRELWARWGAYRTCVYEIEKTKGECLVLAGERSFLERQWCFTGAARKRRAGRLLINQADMRLREDKIRELQIDLEHRILRETRVLMEAMKEISPADGERMAIERQNWLERGERSPEAQKFLRDHGVVGGR